MGLSEALLRRPRRREIALVLGIPTTLFLASSISWQLRRPGTGGVLFTDGRILATLLIEAAIAAVMLFYLSRRGWKPMEVAGTPEPHDVLRGLGLWFGVITSYAVVFIGLHFLLPDFVRPLEKPQFTGSISAPVILAAALINPLFEEFLWLGYAIPALGNRFGLRTAVVVSVLLRVLVHVYQGRMALIAILPLGAVLTWYYVRTKRLWPVVVAHVVVDALALSSLMSTT
ncbi:MAG: CPBP family intramembrane glutamic endopeptidase [Gemmatimonadaceae bacterium]|jgi:membrane protease YdiL (CAAX protease family)